MFRKYRMKEYVNLCFDEVLIEGYEAVKDGVLLLILLE